MNNPDSLSATELRGLKTLETAECAEIRAQAAKRAARKILAAENEKVHKARTHNMINAAGLLGLAGMLDKTTGKPLVPNEQLLGALIELANSNPTENDKARWAEIGTTRLAQAKAEKNQS